MSTPGWQDKFEKATTPEQRLAIAYDAVRSTAARLARKRTTGFRVIAQAFGAQNDGERAAAEFRDEVAYAMVNAAHKAWRDDWHRTWSSGHGGQMHPHAALEQRARGSR